MFCAHTRYALAAVVLIAAQAAAADLSKTLRPAEELIEQHKFSAAINALETILPQAQGDEQVLELLRQAYRGEIRELVLKGERKAAQGYLDRLRLIERVPDTETDHRTQPRSGRGGSSAGGWTKSESGQQAENPAAPASEPAMPNGPSPGVTTLPSARPSGQKELPSVKVLSVGPAQKTERAEGERPTPSDQSSVRDNGPDQSRLMLRRADALFLGRRYAEAGRLYEQVHSEVPGLLDEARDRWTYCRLASVVEQINRQPQSQEEWSRIKGEVDSILQTIPGNEYALSLRQVTEQHGKQVEVAIARGAMVIRASAPDSSAEPEQSLLRGLANRIGLCRNGDSIRRSLWQRFRSGGWQVLETANFRIYHTDENVAGPAADIAESTRIELYRTWFGRLPDSNWNPKCDIYIHPAAESYISVTGQGPGSPGHSATGLDRGRILSRRIDLRRDGQDLIHAVLPHEITHVVMADRFPNRPLPRWADEGMAVLTEPPEKKIAHLRNLNDFARNGRLYSARQLMTMGDYPPGPLWGMFYAQSVSLVEFLAERGGPAKFVEFMSHSLQSGYEPELKRLYGLSSFEQLDQEWSQRRATEVAAADGRMNR